MKEEKYIYGGKGCMHEIYAGENAYVWDGELLCPDCFKEKIEELTLEELAFILDVEIVRVHE